MSKGPPDHDSKIHVALFCYHIIYYAAKLFPIYFYLFNDSFTYPKKKERGKANMNNLLCHN